SYKAQIDNLLRERDRLRLRTEQAAESLASLDVELQELTEADGTLHTRLAEARQTLADQRQERERLGVLRDETNEALPSLRPPRVRPAHRPGPGRLGAALPGARFARAGRGTGGPGAAAFRPRQLPAATAAGPRVARGGRGGAAGGAAAQPADRGVAAGPRAHA